MSNILKDAIPVFGQLSTVNVDKLYFEVIKPKFDPESNIDLKLAANISTSIKPDTLDRYACIIDLEGEGHGESDEVLFKVGCTVVGFYETNDDLGLYDEEWLRQVIGAQGVTQLFSVARMNLSDLMAKRGLSYPNLPWAAQVEYVQASVEAPNRKKKQIVKKASKKKTAKKGVAKKKTAKKKV